VDGERAAVIDCDDVTNWLAGTSRPSPDQARALAAHLATCDECRELAEGDAAQFRWLSRISLAALDDPARLGLPVVDPIVFSVAAPLAKGGMGQISRARDRRLDREVALKEMLDPSLRERFEREVHITARLQHPAIIPIYEAGKWPDGSAFYTMRLVDGGTLHDAIAGTQTLEARLALLPHVRAVSEALAYAHAQRVIHRDLKPGNVLVGKFGETVVIDWGLAKQLSSAPDVDAPIASRSVGPPMAPRERALVATAETMADVPAGVPPREAAQAETAVAGGTDGAAGPVGSELVTRAGSVLGTPGFMSPEQAAGEEVDERADVYALGGILYNLLAGHPPYFDLDIDWVTAALLRPPTPIAERAPGAPADLCAIVERAMARPASARYPTAQQFVEDLRRFEAGQLLKTREYGLRELVARWLRRHRTAVIAGSIAVVAVLAIAIAALIGIARSEAREHDARQVAEQARGAAEADTARLLEEHGRTALLSGDRDRALAYLAAAYRHGRDTLAVRHLMADADRDLELTAGELATRGADIASFGWAGDRAVTIQRGETAAMTVWAGMYEAATSPITGGALRSWLSQDTRRAAVLTYDHRLAIYDTEAGRQLWALDGLDTTNADIDVVFSPAGDRVVVMNHVRQVTPAQLFDVATGARIALPAAITRGRSPDLDPVAAAFSRDGKLLAIGRLDNTVIVWAIGAPAPLRTWSPYRVWEMAFAHYVAAADDVLVITTGERPEILPLDGRPPIPIASRTAGLPELAVSPDGELIALGDTDNGTVQLWTTLAQWRGEAHDLRGGITALRFSPDGSLLLGGGEDKRAAVWETPSLTLRGMVVASRGEATAGDYYPRITALAAGGWPRWAGTNRARSCGARRRATGSRSCPAGARRWPATSW
jgi:serine/threonine protein kinase